jgi:hypothetical protein
MPKEVFEYVLRNMDPDWVAWHDGYTRGDGGGWVARTVPAMLMAPFARPRPTTDRAEWERCCYLHFTLHERYGMSCEHATAADFRAPGETRANAFVRLFPARFADLAPR